MSRTLPLLLCALLATVACADEYETVPFVTVGVGREGPAFKAERRILKSQADVQDVLELRQRVPAVRSVDFRRHMLIYASLGLQRDAANATVEVQWVRRRVRDDGSGSLQIGIRERRPAAGDPRELGYSAPFHLVRIPAYPDDDVHIASWRSRTGTSLPARRAVWGKVHAKSYPNVMLKRKNAPDLTVVREADRALLRPFGGYWVTVEADAYDLKILRIDRLISPVRRTLEVDTRQSEPFRYEADLSATYVGATAVPLRGATDALTFVHRDHLVTLDAWIFTTLAGRPFEAKVERIQAVGTDASRLRFPRKNQRLWIVGKKLNSGSLWIEQAAGGSRSFVDARSVQIGRAPGQTFDQPRRTILERLGGIGR